MRPPETFTRALAIWTKTGRRVRFAFAGDILWPEMTETLQECVAVWLRTHREPARRRAISAELATVLQWWAEGARLDDEPLDIRARFKAIEFVLWLSAALPALLDNAGPLLRALKSRTFEALPDSTAGDVPLRSALLTQAISALGAWCLSDDFDLRKVDPAEREDGAALALYVSALPLDTQDTLACFAAVLCICPGQLKAALPTLKRRLPKAHELKADARSHAAVRIVLGRAARIAKFEVIEALQSAKLHAYLELLELADEAAIVSGYVMDVQAGPGGNFVVTNLLPGRYASPPNRFPEAMPARDHRVAPAAPMSPG